MKNGALVLRHELGHSITEIGEAYCGGYFGVDAATSPETVGWSVGSPIRLLQERRPERNIW